MKTVPCKVLLIDSEMLIHLAVAQAYRNSGPYFISAANAAEALKKMEVFKFDLFLLALDIKDEDSLLLLQIIDQRFPDAPVILMSNDETDYGALIERIEMTRKQGSWQLIEKPFNIDILTVLIERCIYERERSRCDLKGEEDGYEKRNSLRSSHVQTIQMLLNASATGYKEDKSIKATVTDISDGGLGLITKYPLKHFQPVRFTSSTIGKTGIVAWTSLMDNHICRAGIQFR